ncbi:MAG: sensor histidine kinase [Pseudomonadota bacterium]
MDLRHCIHTALYLALLAVIGLIVLSGTPGHAQLVRDCPVASLSGSAEFEIDLGPYACAFPDDGRTLTLKDVLSERDDVAFAPLPGGLVDFGFGDSRYWVAVRLRNDTDTNGSWWITHDIPVASTLNVHLIPEGAVAERLLTLTDQSPFAARPIPHRHLVSEITLQADETALLLIDYTSDQATEMPLFAESVPQFFTRTQAETVEIAALTALVLGMGFISTIYLYGLDGRPALVYGVYVLAGVALLVHMEGYTFQYVWPRAPGLNQMALAYIAPTLVALGTFFVDRFTQARRHHPGLHLFAVFMIGVLVALVAVAPLLITFVWYKNSVLFAVCFGTAMQVVLAVAAMRRGQSGAGLLVLGFGALAAAIIFGAVGYLTEGLFEQELAGLAIRLGFLLEAIAFSAAIALRVRAARRERDAALKAQIRLSEERLNLSEALRRAEDDRQTAANAAVRSQEALASTAHDIRQPLASLQLALSSGDAAQERITSSLNYLEEIVRAGLEENSAPLGAGDNDPPIHNARERFRADIVLNNIAAMFGAEAARQGVTLTVMPCAAHLVADPLALMRSLGNLVSNALHHAQARRILVGCRRSDGTLRFEVHDDGCGMSHTELARALHRGNKGAGSNGHGLGLAIVTDIAGENGFGFDIRSDPGRGTVAHVTVPLTPAIPAKETA